MGHLGGELSIVEVAVALYYKYLKYDPKNPKWEDRDRLVLSKGHCSETLYTIFADLGIYTIDDMVEHVDTLDTAVFACTPTGSMSPPRGFRRVPGHGLPISVGLARAPGTKKKNWRTIAIVGDGRAGRGHQLGGPHGGRTLQLGTSRLS